MVVRFVLTATLICAAGLAAATGFDLLGRIERALIYPFDGTRTSPSDAGLTGVTETLWAHDGETLVVWHAAPRAGAPIIVYFHGNAGNLAVRAQRFAQFRARGYGLLALSPRSAGGSSGTPSEPALTADAAALLRDAARFVPAATPDRLVIYGESLGTAVSLAAVEASGIQPAAIVLEAPFTSTPDIAKRMDGFPESLLPRIRDRWDSASRIGQITAPLLVIHGTSDTVVPYPLGKALFDAAPGGAKRMITVRGAGHSDLWRSDVTRQMFDFIERPPR